MDTTRKQKDLPASMSDTTSALLMEEMGIWERALLSVALRNLEKKPPRMAK